MRLKSLPFSHANENRPLTESIMVSKKRERGQQKRHAPQSQVDTSTGAWQQASASASAQPPAQQAEAHSSAHARAYNLTRASNRLARAVRYAQSRVENFDARKSKIKRKKLKQALKLSLIHI